MANSSYSPLVNCNCFVFSICKVPTKISALQAVPNGFRQLLIWLKNEYGNPPIVVSENGYGDDGVINDSGRINYIKVFSLTNLYNIHYML